MKRPDALDKIVRAYHTKMEFPTLLVRMTVRGQASPAKFNNAVMNYLAMKRHSPNVGAAPTSLMIEPTNRCNLNCMSCPASKNSLLPDHIPSGLMGLDQFRSIVDDCHRHVTFIALYFLGEPYMHKDLLSMVRYAAGRRLNVRMSTNGHFLHDDDLARRTVESGLDTIMISISGASQESYEKYHAGGDFDLVVGGIKKLLEARRRVRSRVPRVSIRYLVTADNRHELDRMKGVARAIGPDYVSFRPAIADSPERAAEHSVITNYSGRGGATGEVAGLEVNRAFCSWPWLMSVIRWNGDVVPCCSYDLALPNLPPRLGNVFADGGIRAVWRGEGYRAFRRQVAADKSKIEVCKYCRPLKFEGFGI